MPVEEAAGCLLAIGRACLAILEFCSDFFFVDEIFRAIWWSCKALGRIVVLVFTFFQVWLSEEHDVLAGIIGLVTLVLIIVGCIQLTASRQRHATRRAAAMQPTHS